jgi:hypothetical protein
VGAVSASFFDFFDARPALGRFFGADEDVTPRGADVAVLSYAFWRTAFGGRDVRGEVLQVGNVRAVIIGVAPAGFDGVDDANPPVVYLPITTYAGSTGTDDARTYFNRYRWAGCRSWCGGSRAFRWNRPKTTRRRRRAAAGRRQGPTTR